MGQRDIADQRKGSLIHRRHATLGVPISCASLPIDTIALARRLIGLGLGVDSPCGVVGGRIVEAEGYLPDDPASHSYRGQTPRNRVMFGPPHHAYLYFIYGNHWCFNITTESRGIGAAILIRAIEPLVGVEVMARRRRDAPVRELARGPGRLAEALDLGSRDNGLPIGPRNRVCLYDMGAPVSVAISPRVGISRAQGLPLRFTQAGSRFVSSPLPRLSAMV